MIKHIVSYQLIDNSLEKRLEAKNVLMSMKGKIDLIKDINVGIDILGSERSYDIVLEMVFDSLEDMAKYQKDEYHVTVVKKYMHSVRKTSVSVDYQF